MVEKRTAEDDALLAELGVAPEEKAATERTPREERIIAGFEEIQRFVDEHGRTPQHGETRDIFERMYAVRLDRIRELDEATGLLAPMDHQGLLQARETTPASAAAALDDEALLAELGVAGSTAPLTELRHVRSASEKRMAEEIANRQRCEDFDAFEPLFGQVQRELDAGVRETRPFERKSEIEEGRFFVLGGQKAYVAEVGDYFVQNYGDRDARLRVIFDNGTESNLLMRSLQRALHKDEAGRKITEPGAGPLFDDEVPERASGTIYVLRSNSADPAVAKNREVLHKIGVTSGSVERRVANAKLDPTFLMADVEIVATYELYSLDRKKLEQFIHRVFGRARLDVQISDRFGRPVSPREWFLVPLSVIDEAIQRIQDGSITEVLYDPKSASLVPANGT